MFNSIKNERTTPSNSPEHVAENMMIESDNDVPIEQNKDRKPILPNLLKNSKRLYGGLEYIIEFQLQNLDDNSARFYCRTCQSCFEMNTIVRHCTSLIHLFRYIKSRFPIYYEMITGVTELPKRIIFVKKMTNIYSNRVSDPKLPELVLLKDLGDAFYDYVHKIDDPLVYIEHTDSLNKFNEGEELSVESQDRLGGQSILQNVKRCVSPTRTPVAAGPSGTKATKEKEKAPVVAKPDSIDVDSDVEESSNNEDKLLIKVKIVIDEILNDKPISIPIDYEIIAKLTEAYKNKIIEFNNKKDLNKVLLTLQQKKSLDDQKK